MSEIIDLTKNSIGNCKCRQQAFFWANIFVGTLLIDLLHISSICQHCDEQQFQTLSCVHYTLFSLVKSDLFIRALLLDRILVTEKTMRTPRVHLVLHAV